MPNLTRAHTGPKPRPVAERFWRLVDRLGQDECWIWRGGKNAFGHGTVWNGVRTAVAHRVAWELLVGPISPSLHLDHFRMNPGPRNAPCSRACVNPAHVEPVTPGQNVLRGNGSSANRARQTACIRGHPFDEKNTRRNCRGERVCRTCENASKARHYAVTRHIQPSTNPA
jgi:hypothetical protein